MAAAPWPMMRVFGLTGGVGVGKSTCTEYLRSRGMAVLDTDDVARELVETGTPALREIIQQFGPTVVDERNCLRRDALAEIVFDDSVARQRLENILHPRIQVAWKAWLEELRAAGRTKAAVVIPLLFETGAGAGFDVVVCVACSQKTQQLRLQSRGWSSSEIERRIAAQLPITQKMDRAHHVIWSEGSVDALQSQAARVFGLE